MGGPPGIVQPSRKSWGGRLGHWPTLSLSAVFWEVLEAMEMVSGWLSFSKAIPLPLENFFTKLIYINISVLLRKQHFDVGAIQVNSMYKV